MPPIESGILPKELLQQKIAEWKSTKEKTQRLYDHGNIDQNTYDQYMGNINPILQEYEYALQILNTYA